jgi:hypothetical protein
MNDSITGNAGKKKYAGQLRIIIINKHRQLVFLPALICTALFATPAAAASHHVYTVRVDADFKRLEVRAQFDEPVKNVAARARGAEQFLLAARHCDGDAEIAARGRRLVLPERGVECFVYTVDLQRAARAEQRNESLHPDNKIISPAVWMWRPLLGFDDEIEVRFDLPEDLQVSVPWEPVENSANTYRLLASPQSGSAIAIFGRFHAQEVEIGATTLRVDILRTELETDIGAVTNWAQDTANNIVRAYDRFPNPAARIVIFPAGDGRGDSPVRFGRVVRDGGETIELMIDPAQPMRAFYENWTATHEFSHLMLPYLQSEQRWVSEGFAQYYQNVLLARAGRYTQRYTWQKLFDGLERGRESVPGLSPNDAASRDERNSRMKIYWSGAALALLADVELRRRSNGEQTLDAVLGKFQECCLPSQRTWTGTELFTRFDSFLDQPLFMDLYRQHADTAGFPAVRPVLQDLGVIRTGDEVRLIDTAEMAPVRLAITGRDASVPEHDNPPRDR